MPHVLRNLEHRYMCVRLSQRWPFWKASVCERYPDVSGSAPVFFRANPPIDSKIGTLREEYYPEDIPKNDCLHFPHLEGSQRFWPVNLEPKCIFRYKSDPQIWRTFVEPSQKKSRLWQSRDLELSETSNIFKIDPVAKKLRDFKVGNIVDNTIFEN